MKKLDATRTSHSAGFTLVEVLVTIVIASLFIVTFSQLNGIQTRVTTLMTAYDTADLLAYNNLRTYAYGKAPNWFVCTYSAGSPQPMTVLSSTAAVPGLPSPVTQTVVATAPYGCGGGVTTTGYPIKVVSTVIYDTDSKVIVHATYATY